MKRTRKLRTLPAADAAMLKLRIARATLLGVRECLDDAIAFVDRGIEKADVAIEQLGDTLDELGIEISPGRGRAKLPASTLKKRPAKKPRATPKRSAT